MNMIFISRLSKSAEISIDESYYSRSFSTAGKLGGEGGSRQLLWFTLRLGTDGEFAMMDCHEENSSRSL
jgi:hypothetical protein